MQTTPPDRYRAITRQNLAGHPEWSRLHPEQREAVDVVSRVLPFRTNAYVVDQLIDWDRIPADPIFQLTFPQQGMLGDDDFATLRDLLRAEAAKPEIDACVDAIRMRLNPHPAGQLTDNVPRLGSDTVAGLQHKYRETVLFFPAQGQTCHAYCTYCFRWAQFVGMPELKFQARETKELVDYLKAHPLVSDLLFTGGDPMIMKTEVMRRYVEPLLGHDLEHVQTIRFGTKALAYWPYRFTHDDDADDLLRLFEQIIAAGRHVALMAHWSHPREISTPAARAAIARVRSTGAEIRMQAPLVRHVNDDPAPWADLWREGVRLGMVPYYMFVERDTGPKGYFEVPLARAHEIYRQAYRRVSGLARTVRGPSMSAWPGKVRLLGTADIGTEKVFVLDFLQAREPSWVRKPFFARYDARASWLDQLRPFGARRFFFEEEGAIRRDARHELPAWVA